MTAKRYWYNGTTYIFDSKNVPKGAVPVEEEKGEDGGKDNRKAESRRHKGNAV